MVYNYEEGKLVENKELAEELLPCGESFFFDPTGYNQWYYNNIVEMGEFLRWLIDSEDFEEYSYYYEASWSKS